jgi:hypothetical protein
LPQDGQPILPHQDLPVYDYQDYPAFPNQQQYYVSSTAPPGANLKYIFSSLIHRTMKQVFAPAEQFVNSFNRV